MQVTPITRALGAVVEGVDLTDKAAATAQSQPLLELLYQHQVLVLPDQPIEPQLLQALGEQLGPVLNHGAYPTLPSAPAVQVLESVPEAPSKIEQWHTDMTYSARPPTVTLLHAQVVPPMGGDTLWCSTAAAFDALSPVLQDTLSKLTAVHDFGKGFAESLAEPGGAERLAAVVAANPPVSHPLVLQHPRSDRRAIYVNGLFTSRIEPLSALESDHLLAFLTQHVMREEFQMRLQWRPGTLAIWDNRLTQHRPINDYFPAHRRHHRMTLAAV